MIDQEKVKEAVRLLLEGIGEDPEREGLADTPDRIARMYTEICGGYEQDPADVLSRTFTARDAEIVVEGDIPFYSLCEHHMLPFFGKAHIAYLPKGKVAGLSKLARTVDIYARRLQIQENMTGQIADALMEHLDARGVMVILEAEHLCMSMRGVRKPGSQTVTIATRGEFVDNESMQEKVFRMLPKMRGNQ